MAQSTTTVGPGTLVRDATGGVLLAATAISADGNTGWVQVDKPGPVVMEIVLGAIGANASFAAGGIRFEGADTAAGANTVEYGSAPAIAHDDDNKSMYIRMDVYKQFMKATYDITTSGSPLHSANVTLTLHEPHNRQTNVSTAAPFTE